MNLLLHHLFNGLPLLGQTLFDPCQRERQRRALALQSSSHLRHEGTRQRRIGTSHVGHVEDQVGRTFLGTGDEPIRPLTGGIAIQRSRRDPRGDSPQVLDQGLPNHDRKGPQFAQLQMPFLLIRGNEGLQADNVDATIDVRNQFESEVVHARVSG